MVFNSPRDMLKEEKKKKEQQAKTIQEALPPKGNVQDFLDKNKTASSGGGGTPQPQQEQEITDTGIVIFRDKTGRISGFTDPRTGKTFFGGGDKAVSSLNEKLSAQIGGVPVIDVGQRAEQIRQLEATGARLGELGAFEERQFPQNLTPEDQSRLDVSGVSNVVPEIGQSLQSQMAFRALLNIDKSLIKDMGLEEFRENIGEVGIDKAGGLNAEEQEFILNIVRTEIDLETIKTGQADVSRLGVMIEGNPLLNQLGKYIPGITTPEEQADEIVKTLNEIQSNIDREARRAEQGNLDPWVTLENNRRRANKVVELESRLKFTITQSSNLRNNPDKIVGIFEIVDGIYGSIASSRTRSAEGAIKQIREPNEDILIFNQLKGGKKNG
jgi:hypothetical protein